MSVVTIKVQGGEKLEHALSQMAANAQPATLRVGFLEGATYPADAKRHRKGGLHVATVAFWNEFGTRTAPPRPFFRTMIKKKSPGWGRSLARILQNNQYNSHKSMALMGVGISQQLQNSINSNIPPPNAPYTVAKKGFSRTLIDTGVMLRSVDFQVLLGGERE
jgi:hypothetical protein